MRTEEKYQELIIRHLDNSISEFEQDELYRWLKEDKSHLEQYLEVKDVWDCTMLSELSEKDAEGALTDFNHYLRGINKPASRSNRYMKYALQLAATFLLAVLLTWTYLWLKGGGATTHNDTKDYAQIDIPNGHKGQVTLPDGTKIWLNSKTSLRYAAAFDDETRTVYLDGEAYLDVAKDPKRPFLVETSTLKLEVLGTRFNVKSYKDENIMETTLIEGSLRIVSTSASSRKLKEVTLKPNERATFSKDENTLLVDNLNASTQGSKLNSPPKAVPLGITQIESIVAWKDNELIFRDETLEEICSKMERWYGVSILIAGEKLKGKEYRYNGKFIYNETINQVMDIICRTTPIEYTFDKNVLIIKEKY